MVSVSVGSKSKLTNREQILSNAVLLSGSGALGYVFQFVTGLVNPKILGPQQYGIWQIVALITGYAAYSHLGIAQALRREIPMALGRDDEAHAAYVRDVGYSTSMLLSGFFAGIIGLLYVLGVRFKGALSLPLFILIVLHILIARYGTAYSNVLTGYGKFSSHAYFDVAQPALFMVSSIPLVLIFGVPGLVAASTLSQLIAFWLIRAHARVPIRWRLDWQQSWYLVQVGLPILLIVFVARVFQSLELTLAAYFLPVADVGLYGFALGILAISDMIPSSFNQLFLREMVKDYGQSEKGDYRCFQKYLRIPTLCYVFISLMIGQCFFFGFSVLVQVVLQAYVYSLSIMVWLVMGYALFNLRLFGGVFFTVVRRNTLYLAVIVGSLLFNAVLDVAALKAGYGLIGLAIASGLSYLVYSGLVCAISERYVFGSWLEGLKQLARIWLALFLSFTFFYFLHKVPLFDEAAASFARRLAVNVAGGTLKIMLMVAINTVIFSLMFQDMNFWAEIRRNLRAISDQVRSRFVGLYAAVS